jgi:hypothetical protein
MLTASSLYSHLTCSYQQNQILLPFSLLQVNHAGFNYTVSQALVLENSLTSLNNTSFLTIYAGGTDETDSD